MSPCEIHIRAGRETVEKEPKNKGWREEFEGGVGIC